jgi:predicted porin
MKEIRMKKSLLAVALMAAAGAASAQSSVTLFGIVDGTLSWGRGNGPGSSDRFQVTSGGYSTSRLGFRGTEDLGGGLAASFWLEGQVNVDNGTGGATNTNNQASGAAPAALAGSQGFTFARRSTVSLSSNWGELRLGRDYTPQFWNLNVFDPFGSNGVGTSQVYASIMTGLTAVRVSNGIGYFLPAKLGGLYGQAVYYVGENPSSAANHRDGTGAGIRLGYAAGPFTVAVATSYTSYLAGSVHQTNIGGLWDFRVAKLMAMYELDSKGDADASGWLIGALVPVGPGEIRVSYSRYAVDLAVGADPRVSKWALGYVHNLSKRTALYTTYARSSNGGGATYALAGSVTAPNSTTSGLDIGIRHSF